MSTSRYVVSIVFCCLVVIAPTFATPPRLEAYGADLGTTSVSGLSSGGFMAGQLQVAYSKSIVGAGIIAGGPYYCAANAKLAYAFICMGQLLFVPPNPHVMKEAAKQAASKRRIDPLDNLTNRRIYIFSGTDDSVVKPPAVDATASFFHLVGVKKDNVAYVNDLPAGHALIVVGFGNECSNSRPPYLNHCTIRGKPYDQAEALLTHIYGELQPRVDLPTGEVVTFNQLTYAEASAGMASTGYLYVPKTCTTEGGCKVHVALHGCAQAAGSADGEFGDKFHAHAGYNNWADNNSILVLYPQVESGRTNNPQDCWDWWGYSGSNYAYKSGPQMKAIMAMVRRLGQAR